MGARLLLVDDDVSIRGLFSDALNAAGYDVDSAASGSEALMLLAAQPYDVLITDLGMPGMDGWQLIANAVARQPMLRVVVITGREELEDQSRADALGVPLLRKPFDLRQLRTIVQHAIGATRRDSST